MIETKTLGSSTVARIFVLLLLVLSACRMELFSSDRDAKLPEIAAGLQMSVLSATADSVTIQARWSTASDPSGIAQYDWLNWRSTPDTVVAQGSTSFLADTFALVRPPLNETHTFGFQIRAVDGVGNAGDFSPAHIWSLANEDTIAPPPPDTVVVDTLIAAISLWPESVELERGVKVQFYAAILLIETAGEAVDSSIVCDTPPPAQGALYESGSFCCGCDSATAALQRSYQGSAPALIALERGGASGDSR
ncbi:MAG: hypothetical protein JSW46_14765 [Gemmatimonadota bacterium]|nr:MAG: hypothetical protein JSW46_14765 [Gemmatimonadota bacterium]